MLIIWRFPKSIADLRGHTQRSHGLHAACSQYVWDPCLCISMTLAMKWLTKQKLYTNQCCQLHKMCYQNMFHRLSKWTTKYIRYFLTT